MRAEPTCWSHVGGTMPLASCLHHLSSHLVQLSAPVSNYLRPFTGYQSPSWLEVPGNEHPLGIAFIQPMATKEQVGKYPSPHPCVWVAYLHCPQSFPRGPTSSSRILASDLKHTLLLVGSPPCSIALSPVGVSWDHRPQVNYLCSSLCPQGLLLWKPSLRRTRCLTSHSEIV